MYTTSTLILFIIIVICMYGIFQLNELSNSSARIKNLYDGLNNPATQHTRQIQVQQRVNPIQKEPPRVNPIQKEPPRVNPIQKEPPRVNPIQKEPRTNHRNESNTAQLATNMMMDSMIDILDVEQDRVEHDDEKGDHTCMVCENPEDINISQITEYPTGGNIFISDLFNAKCDVIMRKYDIHAVVNACNTPYKSHTDKYIYINIPDRPDVDILSHIGSVNKFIESHLGNGNVLIHCHAGISRSVSFVVAYLMWKHHWKCSMALAHIKNKRPIVWPNEGFMAQLYEYEKMVN
jgi:protein-tyrosine phosphatase